MAFYSFCIIAYHFLVKLLSPFNKKARLFSNGRVGILTIIADKLKNDTSEKIWIHCSSLGEFEQGRPVIEKLKEVYPNKKIILTFFSPSGYEMRKDYDKADYVFYLPADTKRNAKKLIQLVNPSLALFIKYEFWLNYLNVLHKNKVPILLISGIFRKDQHFFKWFGGIFKRTLFFYDHLFLQNEESKQLLNSIGVTQCSVVGDTRFDRVVEIALKPKQFKDIEEFTKSNFTLIAGSTWPQDESHLIKAYVKLKETHQNLKLIIAPHNTEATDIDKLISTIESADKTITWQCYSNGILEKAADIIIIDSIGILSSLYQYGQIAYIGGGFGSGIHNILEAMVYGLPVLFGPNYKKFNEAFEAIKIGVAKTVDNQEKFDSVLNELIRNNNELERIKGINSSYFIKNSGSTQQISDYIRTAIFK